MASPKLKPKVYVHSWCKHTSSLPCSSESTNYEPAKVKHVSKFHYFTRRIKYLFKSIPCLMFNIPPVAISPCLKTMIICQILTHVAPFPEAQQGNMRARAFSLVVSQLWSFRPTAIWNAEYIQGAFCTYKKKRSFCRIVAFGRGQSGQFWYVSLFCDGFTALCFNI